MPPKDPCPVVSTVGGSGAISATFDQPVDVAVGCTGDVFVLSSNQISRICVDGTVAVVDWAFTSAHAIVLAAATDGDTVQDVVYLLAGQGLWRRLPDGQWSHLRDASNLVDGVVDNENRILVLEQWMVTPPRRGYTAVRFAGEVHDGDAGDDEDLCLSHGHWHHVTRIAVDDKGNLFCTDAKDQICVYPRQVESFGPATVIAGNLDEEEFVNGTGTVASFQRPTGIVLDGDGNLIIADTKNHCVRMVASDGFCTQVTTIAGIPREEGCCDGTANFAQFNSPTGVALDAEGNILVADTGNNCIRKIHAGLKPPKRLVKPCLPSTFHTDLKAALDSKLMADVTLIVGGAVDLPAHRVILAARSEHFRALLSSQFHEAATCRIEIADATPAGVRAMLQYLYTDQLDVDDATAVDVLQLSHRYRMHHLHEASARRCREGLALHNAIPWLLQCRAYALEDMAAYLLRYTAQHFGRIRTAARDSVALLTDHQDLMLELLLQVPVLRQGPAS